METRDVLQIQRKNVTPSKDHAGQLTHSQLDGGLGKDGGTSSSSW